MQEITSYKGIYTASDNAPRGRLPGSGVPPAGRRWMHFCGGLLVILLFGFGVIPVLQRLGPVREVRDAIRRTGIDATALFYTESEVSSEAEVSLRDAMKYPAHANRQ